MSMKQKIQNANSSYNSAVNKQINQKPALVHYKGRGRKKIICWSLSLVKKIEKNPETVQKIILFIDYYLKRSPAIEQGQIRLTILTIIFLISKMEGTIESSFKALFLISKKLKVTHAQILNQESRFLGLLSEFYLNV